MRQELLPIDFKRTGAGRAQWIRATPPSLGPGLDTRQRTEQTGLCRGQTAYSGNGEPGYPKWPGAVANHARFQKNHPVVEVTWGVSVGPCQRTDSAYAYYCWRWYVQLVVDCIPSVVRLYPSRANGPMLCPQIYTLHIYILYIYIYCIYIYIHIYIYILYSN